MVAIIWSVCAYLLSQKYSFYYALRAIIPMSLPLPHSQILSAAPWSQQVAPSAPTCAASAVKPLLYDRGAFIGP